MRLVEIIRRPAESERAALVRFVDEMTAMLGTRPMSDHLWLELNTANIDTSVADIGTADIGTADIGTAGTRTAGPNGFIATTISDDSGMVALAQISAANDTASLEVIVQPGLDDAQRVHDDVVETAIDAFRAGGGGSLSWWVDEPTDRVRELAARQGLEPTRGLYEMRRPLPADDHATVDTRAFVPGRDDAAWLAVNNRAFSAHGEQGGWTSATLALRLAEPWFDPDGFRLYERDGRLVAFCWTKLHTDDEPVVGEIYVIAVDPDFHGQGLGRQLTLAGLDSIAARRVTVANLYVDADNAAAVRLYDRLGFTVHRVRQAFTGTLTIQHD